MTTQPPDKSLLRRALSRGAVYWLRVLALALLGAWAGHVVGGYQFWIEARYHLHQRLAELNPRKLVPHYTSVVLIGDGEYWAEPLAGRRPIKRDWLADLVLALDEANAAAIALDIDMRATHPNGAIHHRDYAAETDKLVATLQRTALRRPIILPQTLAYGAAGGYVLDADIFSPWSLCQPDAVARTGIICGYIALPNDMRVIPPTLPLETGGSVMSFALAIAQSKPGPSIDRHLNPEALVYGSYISPDAFDKAGALYRAGDVLSNAKVRQRLAHQLVIVGGGWSSLAHGRGGTVDSYVTPVGRIPGVFIHANFAEALLDARIYRPIPKWATILLELTLVSMTAAMFAADVPASVKTTAVVAVCALLLSLNYFILQNLGTFFDSFVPLVLIVAHGLVDQILEWRSLANAAIDSSR